MATITWTEPLRSMTWDAAKGYRAMQIVQLRVSNDSQTEIRPCTFDLSNVPEVVGGATISSAAAPSVDQAGLTIGGTSISGNLVSFNVQMTSPSALTAAQRWTISCVVTLSTGAKVVCVGGLVFVPAVAA